MIHLRSIWNGVEWALIFGVPLALVLGVQEGASRLGWPWQWQAFAVAVTLVAILAAGKCYAEAWYEGLQRAANAQGAALDEDEADLVD